MSLINLPIPGFYNGVSQQAPEMRLETQLEEQVNGLSSLTYGQGKRPSTAHMAVLAAVDEDSYMGEINRDLLNQFIFYVTGEFGNPIRVYRLNGDECTVRYGELDEDLNFTPDSLVTSYAETSTPKDSIKAVTVADYTFIVNTETMTGLHQDVQTDPQPYEALVWVKVGQPSCDYVIELDGTEFRFSTSATEYDTEDVLTDLIDQIELASGDYQLDRVGSVLRIRRVDGEDFTLSVHDGYGNQGMIWMKGSARDINDLPPDCWDGTKLRINGDTKKNEDDFYMEYTQSNGRGVWSECAGFEVLTDLAPGSLPHRLVHTDTNEFTFCPINWEPRKVGDDITVPPPSFVGEKINNVFFWKNRLGFLTKDNVVMSRSGDFFNFWPKTVLDVLDDDPIDIAATGSEVIDIHATAIHDKNLMLLSQQKQMILTAGQSPLTPNTASVENVTSYNAKPVEPTMAGASVYFACDNGQWLTIREYFIQPETLMQDAADVTAHVPAYIPNGKVMMTANNGLDMLFVHTDAEPGTLFVYKYMWNGNEKPQSAWSRWTFDGVIHSMTSHGSNLYLTIMREGELCLEGIDLDWSVESDSEFHYHVDRKVQVVGTYNVETNITTWTLPYYPKTKPEVIHQTRNMTINRITWDYKDLTVTGNYTSVPYTIGERYTHHFVLSQPFLKDRQGNSITQGRLQIRSLNLSVVNSGYYRVEITPRGRNTIMTKKFTGVKTGVSIIGRMKLLSDQSRTMVAAESGVTIRIVNDSIYPAYFQTGSYEATYASRSRVF